jgi:hypothetical protein
MMRYRALALFGMLACTRCGPDNPTPLSQWGSADLLVQVAGSTGAARSVAVNLTPQNQDKCPALTGSARAEVGGQKLSVQSKGGSFTARGDIKTCEGARFEGQLPAAPAADVVVKVADDSASFEATITNLLTDRKMTVAGDASARLRPGQPASVQVGESSDVVSKGTVTFIPEGKSNDAPAFSVVVGEGTATASGPSVAFTVPASVAAGAGSLRFAGTLVPAVRTCSGFSKCQVVLGVDVTTPAVVQP